MTVFYRLTILTPQGPVYQGEVLHARVPVENGYVGVLANHAPYVTSSSGGRMEIRERGETEKVFNLGAGFFEVAKNEARFLAQSVRTENPAVS